MALRALFAILTIALAVLACGAPPAGESDGDDPPSRTPRVRILVDDHPEDEAGSSVERAKDVDEARYGDPIHIVADGFDAGARVRLEATSGAGASFAVFEVGADGRIDVARDAPEEGSYVGIEPEGLLWSMADPPDGVLDLTVTVRALVDGEERARDALARRFIDDGLVLEDIVDGTTVGTLALPDPARFGPGPYPAVLCFGGSEGGAGAGQFRAMYLASLGVAAFGVGYFGEPGLPDNLVEVPLELLEQDLALLAADPRIDAERIGVMGGSRGGELALLLGAHFPIVKAVIAQSPSGFVWAGLSETPAAAWTLGGAPLSYVPSSGASATVTEDEEGLHVSLTPAFLADIAAADAEALEAATIPIEALDGAVLLYGGDDDQLWPSCAMARVAWERLEARGHAPADRSLCIEGAGHLIGIPGWSTLDAREMFQPDWDAWMVLGGTPSGTARAERAADTALRRFLLEAL